MSDTTQTTWPEGLIARYTNLAGASVAVWDASKWSPTQAICSGCSRGSRDGGPGSYDPHGWAQTHASICRAMPRPDGAQ